LPPDFTPFTSASGFTVFHTRLWIETLLKAFPRWRDASCLIRLPDGRDVLLPMLETDRLGPWRWLDTMPFAFFGGPLVAEGHLSGADMAYILQTASARAGWLAINLDPCDPLANAASLPIGTTPLSTHILKLTPDFEQARKGFTKTVRYDMRRAEREGVAIRVGQGTSDFLIYYQLTQLARQRWQLASPPFPRALYEALAAIPSEYVSLWLAERDGKPIGGLINIHYVRGRVLHWASALDPVYAHLNPTKLLQRKAIREACERGASIYNMGPSVGFDGKSLDGVRQAKEALGAQPHDYAIAIVMNAWALRARALRDTVRGRF
jgi:hypothetical protein